VFVPTTDTWRCLAVALSSFKHPIVVSTIYVAFKVKSKKKLLPEFLYLFLKRQEFDRYARFHSWGSARETFDWDDMCQVILPIPSIEKQEAIINIYHSLEKRKKIRDKLDESIINIGDSNQYNELLSHLKQKDFKKMRSWVVNNIDVDASAIFRGIYDRMVDNVKPSSIPQLVLILADYQYKNAFVADHELNIVACMTEVMANVEFE